MKFFIDTANLAQIREANEMGVLDGGDDQSFADGQGEHSR